MLMLAMSVMFGGRRNIECRAAVEETIRLEREANVANGHHRPIFWSRNMMSAHRIPEHNIGVLYWSVSLCPGRKPCTASMLIRIVPCRIALLWRVRSDPQMLSGEGGTLHHARIRVCEGQNVFARYQLVGHRLTKTVVYRWIDHLPNPGSQWVNHLLCLRLGTQQC